MVEQDFILPVAGASLHYTRYGDEGAFVAASPQFVTLDFEEYAGAAGSVPFLNTDGSGFTVLHIFTGPDGDHPVGMLNISGSTLYGMTWWGGASNVGTVFRLNTDGSGFGLLHEFAGATDGRWPQMGAVLSDSSLYGSTWSGGASDAGVVFQIHTDGTGFTLLHTCTGGNDGANPYVGAVSGSMLYGATATGGASNCGTVFSLALSYTLTINATHGTVPGAGQ